MANVLTSDILKKITGRNVNYDEYVKFLNIYMPEYEINTLPRIQFFIAIAGGETEFSSLVENMSYSSVDRINKVFNKSGTRFTNENVNLYVNSPARLANRVYGGIEMKLGNTQEPINSTEEHCKTSDGYKFRGGGLFQVTGKSNYTKFANDIGVANVYDLVEKDKTTVCIHLIDGAVRSACHYARNRGVLVEADKNTAESFIEACKKVGRCANGDNYAKKREYWARCKAFIGGNGVVEGVDEVFRENTNLTFLTSTDLNVFLNAQQNKP